jgi:glyoxylase-like metal-dependent hydrolase (beta-lactamase superfamily II)
MAGPHVFQVTDGIYCVMRRSYFTCSYIVECGGGLIAVDAGMKSTGREMLAAIEELRRSPADMRAILLTHWHNDHAAGAAELARASGAPIYYSRAEADYFTRRTATAGWRGMISAHVPETGPLVLLKGLLGNAPQRAVDATAYVDDGDTVADDFDVISTPGHTVGHVSYFHRPSGTLFAGDALAVIHRRLRFMSRPVTEDLSAARESMIRCLSRPIRFVCPGHREPLTTDVAVQCEKLRDYVRSGGRWPVFG